MYFPLWSWNYLDTKQSVYISVNLMETYVMLFVDYSRNWTTSYEVVSETFVVTAIVFKEIR